VPDAPRPVVPPQADALGSYLVGIDASRYQRAVNWADLRAQGVDFVYLKASEGATVRNAYFEQHRDGASAAGLLWGAYHFVRPDTPVGDQLAQFLAVTREGVGDLPPVLDVEVDGGIPADSLKARVVRLARGVEAATGRRPMIYSGAAFYRDRLSPALDPYPLWVAQYRETLPSADGWALWQYTDSARLRGVGNQPVSLSVFRGSRADLLRLGQ
jgi:lysozyme